VEFMHRLSARFWTWILCCPPVSFNSCHASWRKEEKENGNLSKRWQRSGKEAASPFGVSRREIWLHLKGAYDANDDNAAHVH